jgi:hypothetical protein
MLFNNQPNQRLTAEDFETRIWGFVVIMVTIILFGIVFSLLYSVTFVTQPIKSMAPIDQAYTKMLNDIVLLIVGGIGGVIGKKGVGAVAQTMAGPESPKPPAVTVPPQTQSALPNFDWMGYKNPELDETWTPGPPPTTPPEHLEDDLEREVLAAARQEVKT